MNEKNNLLIIGPPRSGTTLLAAMLACHSDISILMEDFRGSIKLILSKKIRGVKLCIPNQIELEKRSTLFARVMRRIPLLSSTQYCKNLPLSNLSIRDYQSQKNIATIGIIRAPANVIASMQKRGNQNLKTALFRWSRAMEILHTLLEEDSSSITIVGYEQLTQEPQKTMEKICVFLGVHYHNTLLEGYLHTPQYKKYSGIINLKTDNTIHEYCDAVDKRFLDYYVNLLAASI